MARRKSTQTSDETALAVESIIAETLEAEAAQLTPSETSDDVKVEDKAAKEPATVELSVPGNTPDLPEARSKEEIAATMQEKLSRKTDKSGADPFVPSVQLENEVKEIASKKGFPLSRGTEIGARLMARSKRTTS